MEATYSSALRLMFFVLLTGMGMIVTVHADDFPSVRVFAAGSLRAAINEITNAFQTKAGIRVESSFGPSGTLRDRIAKGEHADLFASADIGNPAALSRAGRAGPVVLFAQAADVASRRWPGVPWPTS